MGAVDGGLGVVALDVAVLGLEDAALEIGEVALRLAVGLRLRRHRCPAARLAAFRLAARYSVVALISPSSSFGMAGE
jgi:hypothetical protein